MSDKTPARSYTSCIACKSEIVAGAVMCPICKSHQSRWKNQLYYFATIAGAITVFITMLTYIVSTWPEIRKTLFWRDIVDVTQLDSMGKLVIYNAGDGKIFVSHLTWRSERSKSTGVIFINDTVENRGFLVHDLNKAKVDMSKWRTASFSQKAWVTLNNDYGLLKSDCIQWHIYHPDDPGFMLIKAYHEDSFRAVPIDATLYFHSGRDGRLVSQNMKLFGVPFLSRKKSCQSHETWRLP